MTTLAKRLDAILKTARDAEAEARKLVVGKRVRIASKRSWPWLVGKTGTVVSARLGEGPRFVGLTLRVRFRTAGNDDVLHASIGDVVFVETETKAPARKAQRGRGRA